MEKEFKTYRFYWGSDDDEQFLMDIKADEDVVSELVDEVHELVGEDDYDGYSDGEVLCELLDREGIEYKDISVDFEINF